MKFIKPFIFLIVIIIIYSCGRKSRKEITSEAYNRINSQINYSDSFIVPTEIDTFFTTINVDTSVKRQVNEFYANRDYQMAWYTKGKLTSAAENFYEKLIEDTYVLGDTNIIFKQLSVVYNATSFWRKERLKRKENLELLLTSSYFAYAENNYNGKVKDLKSLDWYIPSKKRNYVSMLDAIVSGDLSDDDLSVNSYFASLKNYLLVYRQIENNGGWPILKNELLNITDQQSNPIVVDLKNYLKLTGDADGSDNSAVYDNYASKGIASFQKRMGIEATGKIDDRTLTEMNVPVEKRIKQMMINMERMRWFTAPDSALDYLFVNIPSYKLFVYEKGKMKWDMNVVVGSTAHQTTVFKGELSQVVLNPYWHVPESIIDNEMIEKMQQNADAYAASQELEVLVNNKVVPASSVNWSDENEVDKVSIRQLPGANNSLGKYKFLFPNSFSIYLHDTPAKHLFEKEDRAFSHGCIRLSDPHKLATYLLRMNPVWTDEKINEAISHGTEKFINVKPTIPVYIVYFTSWVGDDLKLNFRDDIYENDVRLEQELFDEGKKLSSD